MDYIAMRYKNEKIIIVDLPRSRTIDQRLAEVLEEVKDGHISSSKYQGADKFIKGVKVLVTTNNWIPPKVYKALTEDRWDIYVSKEEGEAGEGSTR